MARGDDYLKPNALPDDLLRIAERLHIPLSDREAQMVAFGVYQRGTPEWGERERIRHRLGNRCIALAPRPRP